MPIFGGAPSTDSQNIRAIVVGQPCDPSCRRRQNWLGLNQLAVPALPSAPFLENDFLHGSKD
jgi:hypothetical protein